MRFSDRFGLTAAPFILRLMLAATFIWAGLGKVFSDTQLPPAAAARLADLGVAVTRTPDPAAAPLAAPSATPAVELPDPEALAEPLESEASDDAEQTPAANPEEIADEIAEDQAATDPVIEADADASQTEQPFVEIALLPVAAQATEPEQPLSATPADFPHGGQARSLYGLALLIDRAANPGLDDQSNPLRPIWPSWLASGAWPTTLAWIAAISELLLGVMVLIGLLTRFAALGLAGVMMTAAWLTQIGPAIQGVDPVLGFLPNHPPFDIGLWKTFAWQLSLLAAALAVACLGSGAIGLDRALFRRPAPAEPSVFDEPEVASPRVDPNRNPFDRSIADDS